MIPVVAIAVEIEEIEQVADRRHVDGHVSVIVNHARVRQVVATALGELAEIPVAFDELHEGRVLSMWPLVRFR